MKTCKLVASGLVALSGLAASASGQTAGADVIVGDVTLPATGSSSGNWGQVGGISAFSLGSTSCNKGDTPLNWYTDSSRPANPELWNQHPVIPQNVYRWKVVNGAGRFEQIGLSFLKHGYTALQQNICNLGCAANPDGTRLGVGCSDPYSASLNGSQSRLGPRSQVNAHTGYFPYPFTAAPTTSVLSRRLQINNNDIAAASNVGALYFGECQYVAPDDATYGADTNDNNNASYRRIQFVYNTTAARYEVQAVTGQATVREQPAIYGWAAAEAGVTITPIDVPGEGRFLFGYKVTPIAGGMYHYEYNLFNLNSDRSASSFTLAFPSGGSTSCIAPTAVEFKNTDYHSGEPYSNTDWAATISSGNISWSSTQTYAQNPNANALRFSTMYTFRFDSARPPVGTGTLTIGLFKPGTPESVSLSGVSVPQPCPCPVVDYNQDGGGDNTDVFDLANDIASGSQSFPGSDPDFNQDGGADNTDVIDLADALASGNGGC